MTFQDAFLRALTPGPARSSRTIASGAVTFGSEVGLVRKENQDRVAAVQWTSKGLERETYFALIVCDGMGGMEAGAECAARACSAFMAKLVEGEYPTLETLAREAVLSANDAVHKIFVSRGGSTLSALIFGVRGQVVSAHVGDSRIYAHDQNGSVSPPVRLTTDDTLSEVFGRPSERGLIQFVGMGAGIRPHVATIEPSYSDYTITSDGAHYVESDVFSNLAVRAPDPKARADRLLAFARWMGGHDNITVGAIERHRLLDHLRVEADASVTLSTVLGDVVYYEVKASSSRNELSSAELLDRSKARAAKHKKRRTRITDDAKVSDQLRIDIEVSPEKGDGE